LRENDVLLILLEQGIRSDWCYWLVQKNSTNFLGTNSGAPAKLQISSQKLLKSHFSANITIFLSTILAARVLELSLEIAILGLMSHSSGKRNDATHA
jgi:hypothetical protein